MSNQVKWVVGVALAALLFAGGYVLGSRKVGPLEEQVEALRLKGQDADTARKNSQAAMDKALKTALAAANDRNAELEKQRKAAARRKGKGGAQVAEVARCTEVLRGQLDP